jgi:hypothetical protein
MANAFRPMGSRHLYCTNVHIDVVTESGSGLGAVYTFDYDANVAGDLVAVTVSVNGSVDHVESRSPAAARRRGGEAGRYCVRG